MWVQKLPPEGDACFSAASTQSLFCGRETRPRQGEPPELDSTFFLPGSPRGPGDKRGKKAGPWVPGRKHEGSPRKKKGKTSDLQGIWVKSVPSRHRR